MTSTGGEFKRENVFTGRPSRIANCPISWCRKTQDVAALPSHGSEFYSAAHSVQEGKARY